MQPNFQTLTQYEFSDDDPLKLIQQDNITFHKSSFAQLQTTICVTDSQVRGMENCVFDFFFPTP